MRGLVCRSSLLANPVCFAITDKNSLVDYLRYWSLRHSPFHTGGRHFFTGAAQRRAIAAVQRWVTQGIRLGVLINPGGCGMTTLLKHLSDSRGYGDCATEFILTTDALNPPSRAIDALAAGLGIKRSRTAESEVAAALNASQQRSIYTVWLIDQSANIAALNAYRISKKFPSLTLITALASNGLTHIGSAPHNGIPLGPLNLKETSDFIDQSLRLAGGIDNPFSQRVVKEIHQLSGGRIKTICRLSESLLAAAATPQFRQTPRAA